MLKDDLRAVATVVQVLVDTGLKRNNPIPPESALDQNGLRDGFDIVTDYLDHGEHGLGFDHIVYMIRELDLSIPAATYSLLLQAAREMKLEHSLGGINVSQGRT